MPKLNDIPAGRPAPGARSSVLEALEKVDTKLYHLKHICNLIGDFAGQHEPGKFTDGLNLEMFAVVFDWVGSEVQDARDGLEEINKRELKNNAAPNIERAAQKMKLHPRTHCIRLNGKLYWRKELTALSPRFDYIVRFDPEDATRPVSLYHGDQLICDVPMRDPSGFRDQQAAKDHILARRST